MFSHFFRRLFKQKLGIVFFLTLILLLLGGGVYFWRQIQPVASTPAKNVRFVVRKGESVQSIAQNLQGAGLIRNQLFFRLLVKQADLGKRLQAGSFQLSSDMTYQEIIKTLTEGTNDVWVTILEGWRREQIAQELATKEELTAFDEAEFLVLTEGLEGRLFPDTYLIAKESTAETVMALLLKTFEQKVLVGFADEIDAAERSFDEVLILASIVEREARGLEEMRHVAGILENRLEIGMALQADATLQYVKGYNPSTENWWSPPRAADKNLESPFNTYINSGLPPQPIANPGLLAIRASLTPLETNNLYYLHGADGKIHYARSLEVHNANVRQYLR